MDLPKVIIKDNYNEFLNGKEVKATLSDSHKILLHPGEKVMAFKDSLAAKINVPVPKHEQSHYIGIEGTITQIEFPSGSDTSFTERPVMKVKRI